MAVGTLVVLVPLVSACDQGGGPDARAVARDLGERADSQPLRGEDACALLGPREITNAYDQPVATGVPDGDVCRFDIGADPGETGAGTLDVGLPAPPGGIDAHVYFASLRAPGALDVPGVGEAAFYEVDPGRVTVLVGGDVLQVTETVLPEPPGQRERLVALARIAADRVGGLDGVDE